ncbi:MAG: hypothetical protein K0S93_4 [Nitrososphaeraceae archaeon]|jgi:hypothetical protein|nr:hypothetical protein [Nitrososphaeraceae archaeon]
MNTHHILLFLTEYEKTMLHLLYPKKQFAYNALNPDASNAIKGLSNIGFVEKVEGSNEYKLTNRGYDFCKIILYG